MGSNENELSEFKVGMYIKALDESGKYRRVEVLEVANGGALPLKVRWMCSSTTKKQKPKETWMRLSECRLIKQIHVDWDDFDRKLPIAQDPHSRETRKQVFSSWDTHRKEHLSLDQLQAGVRKLLGDEFGADLEETEFAVVGAWKAARNLAPPRKKGKKLAAKMVDLKEFHAFIIALRYYLSLAEIFEYIDSYQEDDQRLSFRECKKGMFILEEWGITDEKLAGSKGHARTDRNRIGKKFSAHPADDTGPAGRQAEKFKGHAPWTPVVRYEDFAKWCIEERWSHLDLSMELDSSDDEVQFQLGASVLRKDNPTDVEARRLGKECMDNRKKVLEVFAQADTNSSGKISEDELVAVFEKLNSRISPEVAKRLFAMADSNKDGQVDYEEFCLWLFH